MNTKALLLVCAIFAVGVSLEIPGILSQGRGARMNANLMDIGVSVAGVTACVVVAVIKNAKARNSGQ
jgi:hypothetical protein